MERFKDLADLKNFLRGLDVDYEAYAPILWESGIRRSEQLANNPVAELVAAGIRNKLHAGDIKARSAAAVTTAAQAAGGGGLTGGPAALQAVQVVFTDQQAAAALQQFAQHYDAQAGQRLLGLLSHRAASTPIAVNSSARALGEHFRLLGYRPVIKALGEVLLAMENNLQLKTSDAYKRVQHILQLAGPPGLGKTTAATALWAAMHYACSSSSWDELFSASPVWQKMRKRILTSLSPSKLLVFCLDFAEVGLKQLHQLEADLAWEQILAWRLLYGALAPGFRKQICYGAFLESVRPLLQKLKPCHVAAFVRQQAGFSKADDLLMVWVFDEAQAFEASMQPTDSAPKIAELLSAFVDFRVECFEDQSATLPVCVATSTLWSRTLLLQTSAQRAKIADLQLLPLADVHCQYILNDVCNRIRQWQQQQQQGQQQGQQPGPPAPQWQQQVQQGPLGPQWQQEHMLDCAAVLCEQTQWPDFELQSSANMVDDLRLPAVTMHVLQLVGGIPRLLSYSLAAMAGKLADQVIQADRLLLWQSQPPSDFNATKLMLIKSAGLDHNWRQFESNEGTRQLLEIAFAYDACQESVPRGAKVVLPPGYRRDSTSTSSSSIVPGSAGNQTVCGCSSLLMRDGGG